MKKVFHKVYIFQPASSGASVKNNVFDKLRRANLQQLTEDLNQVYNDIQALPKIIINVLF
jgi:hypothetical protein